MGQIQLGPLLPRMKVRRDARDAHLVLECLRLRGGPCGLEPALLARIDPLLL